MPEKVLFLFFHNLNSVFFYCDDLIENVKVIDLSRGGKEKKLNQLTKKLETKVRGNILQIILMQKVILVIKVK